MQFYPYIHTPLHSTFDAACERPQRSRIQGANQPASQQLHFLLGFFANLQENVVRIGRVFCGSAAPASAVVLFFDKELVIYFQIKVYIMWMYINGVHTYIFTYI